MRNLFLSFLLMGYSAMAANLEDVDLLSISHGNDGFELKLHAKSGPNGSYFFVNISKNDVHSFDKLALVIKKLEGGNNFKLDLNIKSFSMAPSGSYYRGEFVNFSGTDLIK